MEDVAKLSTLARTALNTGLNEILELADVAKSEDWSEKAYVVGVSHMAEQYSIPTAHRVLDLLDLYKDKPDKVIDTVFRRYIFNSSMACPEDSLIKRLDKLGSDEVLALVDSYRDKPDEVLWRVFSAIGWVAWWNERELLSQMVHLAELWKDASDDVIVGLFGYNPHFCWNSDRLSRSIENLSLPEILDLAKSEEAPKYNFGEIRRISDLYDGQTFIKKVAENPPIKKD